MPNKAIAEQGGVELVYTMYCDLTGQPLPAAREQRYGGAKWVYLRRDVQSALHYWRRGELSLGQWWRTLRGRKAYAVLSWTDPVPFLGDLMQSAAKVVNGRSRAGKAKSRRGARPADIETSATPPRGL